MSPSQVSVTATRGPSPRWHTLGNRLTGLRLTDEATCYKLFKRDVLDQIELTEDGLAGSGKEVFAWSRGRSRIAD